MLTLIQRWFPHTRTTSDADGGFTLMELIVVVGIMSVIGTIVSGTIIQSMQASRREQERVFTVSTAQTALERLSRDLRTSDPLMAANLNDVSMLVYRSGHCELRRWWVDPSAQLMTSTARYTTASTSCATRTGTTATPVIQVVMDNAGVELDHAHLPGLHEEPELGADRGLCSGGREPADQDRPGRAHHQGPAARDGAPVFLTSSIDLRNVEQLP